MSDFEQQINGELSRAEEQQQLNHIRWMCQNNNKKSFYAGRPKDEGLSDWTNSHPSQQSKPTPSLASLFRSKDRQRSRRQGYLLEALKEEEEEGEQFFRYDKGQSTSTRKQGSKLFSPNQVNLKLPLPRYLGKKMANLDSLQQQSTSFPMIKKVAIPKYFRRDSDRRREKSSQQTGLNHLMMRDSSEVLWNGLDGVERESVRRGRMMGMTRRQLKNYSFCSPKLVRNSVGNSRLRECITFMK